MNGEATLGLILNGGQARRMSGADKGLVRLAGRPMLAHVIDRLRPQCAMLALNANGDPSRFARFRLAVIADDPPGFAGPLAGVLAGLEFCAAGAPRMTHVVTLAADTPFAPRDLVVRLDAARQTSGAAIAVAASGGRAHHVASLWPVGLAPALRNALTNEGLRRVEAFAGRFPVAVVEWEGEPFDPFFNVNTPEDLARAEAMLNQELGPGRVKQALGDELSRLSGGCGSAERRRRQPGPRACRRCRQRNGECRSPTSGRCIRPRASSRAASASTPSTFARPAKDSEVP